MQRKFQIAIVAAVQLLLACNGNTNQKKSNNEHNEIIEDVSNISVPFIKLPAEYNTPDGLALSQNGDLILSVPNFNNNYLLEHKMIKEASAPFMAMIEKNNSIQRTYNCKYGYGLGHTKPLGKHKG
ncbi:MAG: hypothetical protein JWQ25_1774 [Daejeonella sp.]|nr:hypothetical protein [Daejeonella sp.]